MMEILKVPQGELRLSRFPLRKKDLLRAWNAADEYLLKYFDENFSSLKTPRILVINDSFAALSTALNNYNPVCWSDSFLTKKALKHNLLQNNLTSEIPFVKSTDIPGKNFEIVLLKIPKSHALLEDQLAKLSQSITPETRIIAAGMAKNIHTSTLDIFEKYLGATKTSLAVKKARLIFCHYDKPGTNKSPYPKTYMLDKTGWKITNYANVFSREKLDIGTRFFLDYITMQTGYKNIIDLGCGNGVAGLIAKKANPGAKVIFTDESYMAVESARINYLNLFEKDDADFYVTDVLEDINIENVDLVLNNPPFHQQHTVGDFIARKMFMQSKYTLRKGGKLLVIGNRHLQYHVMLKKIFGNCDIVASNKKFVILQSIK